MADSNVPQYPAMFDPSQMLNKYSDMNSAKFPMYNYYGTPTDAMGRPIAAYKPPATPIPSQTPGTTLTSAPTANYDPRIPNLDFSALAPTSPGGPGTQAQLAYNLGLTAYRPGHGGFSSLPGQSGQSQPGQQQQQGSAGIPSAGFNYLTALANPDKVATPGVTPPPQASQPGPINLDALIAQLRGGGMTPPQSQTGIVQGTAPSNGFLQTLAALRAGSPGAK
jgi:hypothetical protein